MLCVVVNFVSIQLNPIGGFVTATTGLEPASEAAVELLAMSELPGVVFLGGAIAEYRPRPSDIGTVVEALVARLRGIGSLYRRLDEMGGLKIETDTESFREIKLVGFPVEDSYAIAFVTAETPPMTVASTGMDGMVIVFLTMAPNPVMVGVRPSPRRRACPRRGPDGRGRDASIVTSGVVSGRPPRQPSRNTYSNVSKDGWSRQRSFPASKGSSPTLTSGKP